MTSEKKTVEDEAANAKDDLAMWKFDLVEAEMELTKAEEKLIEVEAEAANAKDDLAMWKFDLVEAEKKLAGAEKKLTGAEKKLAGAEKKLIEVEAEAANAKDDLAMWKFDLVEAEMELTKAEEKLIEVEAEAANAKDDLAMWKFDLVEAEKKLAGAEKKLTGAEEKLAGAEKKLIEVEAEAANAKDDLAMWKFDLVEAEKKLAGAEKKLTGAEEKLAGAEKKLTGAEEKLAGAEKKLTGAEEKLAGAEKKLTEAEEKLAGAEKKLTEAEEKLAGAEKAAKMVRFGSITADPGEVLDATGQSGSGGTVPITLKKVKVKDGVKLELGGFGEDLDETELRLLRIAGFVGTEFKGDITAGDDGTTKIRAVAWSDVKTLSKLGGAPLYSGEDIATAGLWNWIKVDQKLKRTAGDGESQYVVMKGTPVEGNYDDVPGVYTCEQEAQAVYCSGGGDVTGTVGVIKFTPKADYLSFGAWMIKTSAKGDAPPSPVVGVFAMGGPEFDIVKHSPEDAQYKGGATGFYAKREVGTDASAGSYTADVSLTAEFENNAKVSGEVTNFQDMRNGMALGWEVKLEGKYGNIKSEENGNLFNGFTKSSVNFGGDEHDLSGEWEGKFYGENAPSYAAGTFNARTGDPADRTNHYLGIIGAFGAKLKPQAK